MVREVPTNMLIETFSVGELVGLITVEYVGNHGVQVKTIVIILLLATGLDH